MALAFLPLSPHRWFLIADARQRGAGVNVERPQPQARTNDVDAGDERRTITQDPAAGLLERRRGTQR